jgi:hypothetical protein
VSVSVTELVSNDIVFASYFVEFANTFAKSIRSTRTGELSSKPLIEGSPVLVDLTDVAMHVTT